MFYLPVSLCFKNTPPLKKKKVPLLLERNLVNLYKLHGCLDEGRAVWAIIYLKICLKKKEKIYIFSQFWLFTVAIFHTVITNTDLVVTEPRLLGETNA